MLILHAGKFGMLFCCLLIILLLTVLIVFFFQEIHQSVKQIRTKSDPSILLVLIKGP